MVEAKTITTPISTNVPLTLFNSDNLSNTIEYHQVIGNL